jgi:hypothetical protein
LLFLVGAMLAGGGKDLVLVGGRRGFLVPMTGAPDRFIGRPHRHEIVLATRERPTRNIGPRARPSFGYNSGAREALEENNNGLICIFHIVYNKFNAML